ncbi:MAG: carotenoid biosynthesis protein [Cyclobacteriaceae bacterium]
MKKSKEQIVGWVFIILHLVGIAGFSIEATRELFQFLTPFNLLISLGLLLWLHTNRNNQFILLSLLVGLLGYLVEVVGVNTGQIFGNYTYGKTLGFQLWQTPLIIGVNWLMMIYYTSAIAKRITGVLALQIAIGAALMVLMDLLIEPVAIQFDYWTWSGDVIPLQNYFGWFVTALLLHAIYSRIEHTSKNGAAPYLAFAQLIFFAVLNVLRTL